MRAKRFISRNKHPIISGAMGTALISGGPTAAFFRGFSGISRELKLIPRAELAEQFRLQQVEERRWWKGRNVQIELLVELPFWLMIPTGEFSITHERTTIPLSVRSNVVQVFNGPTYLSSQDNVVYVDPDSKAVDVGVPSDMPISRLTRSLVVFKPHAKRDVFPAWRTRGNIESNDHSAIRRINRSTQYLESLAFAHIPFLNRLITAYRSTSHDPFAFEVTEWDVPIWFAKFDDTLVRISLMPYSDTDVFPEVRDDGVARPYFSTTLASVERQADSPIAPGKLELLDAYSLLIRGRYEDAVRSAVTAIEVAVEQQIAGRLRHNGFSELDVKKRLLSTRDDFFARIADYEQLFQRRIPGPILNPVPYINGIRFKSELDWVRKLRHRIVHNGVRIDIANRGQMQRAFETMSWLYNWLTPEDRFDTTKNTTFFSLLRGQLKYPYEYAKTGVRVKPLPLPNARTSISNTALYDQYLNTTTVDSSDFELCVRMSFAYLNITCEDGPPDAITEPKLRERYLIQYGRRKAIVFCIECDDAINPTTMNSILLRSAECKTLYAGRWHRLIIVNHQRQIAKDRRNIEGGIPDEVLRVVKRHRFTIISALDVQLLVRGNIELKWPVSEIRSALFAPGRQRSVPSIYHKIGVYRKPFPRHSAISVAMDPRAIISVGDIIALRIGPEYKEVSPCIHNRPPVSI